MSLFCGPPLHRQVVHRQVDVKNKLTEHSCMGRINPPPSTTYPRHHDDPKLAKIINFWREFDRYNVGQVALDSSWLGINNNGDNFRFTLTTTGKKIQ